MSQSASIIEIDCEAISDWSGFHETFARKLGFPAFYGRNADAWIDCMTSLDDPSAGLSKEHVERGQIMTLQLSNASSLKGKSPEIFEALNEMAAFVNWRRIEVGEGPVLALSYHA